MKARWDIDDDNIVEAHFNLFKKNVVTLNGNILDIHPSLRRTNKSTFSLADGRPATISVTPKIGLPRVNLRVGDHLMFETGPRPIYCIECKAVVKPNDQHCEHCGVWLPRPNIYANEKNVKQAAGAIKTLAVLFAISGLVMFFITQSNNAPLLLKLDGMDPQALLPNVVNGVAYTVTALKARLVFETWAVLVVNLLLSAIMVALTFWSKRAPLPAILVATATFAVVQVGSAIVDPTTIGQGLLVKIVVISFLVSGIKAALALRSMQP